MGDEKRYNIGIEGKLNIFGLEIDLEKLIAGEGINGLEKLREKLKKMGGKETLSDEEWKAGGVSFGGHIRTSGTFGEREYDLGIKQRKTYRAKPAAEAPRDVDIVEPYVDVFYEKDGKHVTVLVEMPGVEEKDIKINIEGEKLILSGDARYRKYQGKAILDYVVNKEFDKSYKNGVLEIKLERKEG